MVALESSKRTDRKNAMTKPLQRTCKAKSCRKRFSPKNNGQVVHTYQCGIEYTKQLREKKEKDQGKDIRRKNKKIEREMMTLSDYKKEFETVFNAYIRERDKNDPCISCGSTGDFRRTAGHYFPTTHGSVRFHEDNVNVQCWYNCNKNRHGNLSEYLPRLIKKIGKERFEEMERIKNQERSELSIPEVILLKEEYKEKLRKLKYHELYT